MKKRVISMLLAGVMALSLAACGSSSDDKKRMTRQRLQRHRPVQRAPGTQKAQRLLRI